ncbi:GDP-mannose mannosyl hydrolase, partial [Escherichia coli]
RACISLAGITKSHWKRGLPALTSGSLRIETAFGGNDVFTSGRLCHGSALHTACLSRLYCREQSRRVSAWQKNQPPGAGLLVCAGRARAERRNAGSRI